MRNICSLIRPQIGFVLPAIRSITKLFLSQHLDPDERIHLFLPADSHLCLLLRHFPVFDLLHCGGGKKCWKLIELSQELSHDFSSRIYPLIVSFCICRVDLCNHYTSAADDGNLIIKSLKQMKLLIILTILPDAIENDRRDFNQRVPVAINMKKLF